MSSFFPELKNREELIIKTLLSEEESFNKTLDRGIELFNREVKDLKPGDQLSGNFTFKLYDTYGFPLDLTELMARESELSVDVSGFENEMEQQRERARQAHKSIDILVSEESNDADATEFSGFEMNNLKNFSTRCIDVIEQGDTQYLVFEKSPFYAEMGGQVGDSGSVFIGDQTIPIVNTLKDKAGRFLHQLKSSPDKADFSGQDAVLNVHIERRQAIQRHHTATHVLHWALRTVLGEHIRQAGSLVEPDRLRFDFSHFEAIKPKEIEEIEHIANKKLLLNDTLESYEVPFSEKPEEVIAFFDEKYGDKVRVVNLGGWSQELCGGTHVSSAGEIGSLRIISESAISAGTRRIEAVAGFSAFQWTDQRVSLVQELTRQLACKPDEVTDRISQIQAKNKQLDKKLRAFEQKGQAGLADQLIESAEQVGALRIIKSVIPDKNSNDLRSLAAQVNKRVAPSVVLLASESGGKFGMVCICSQEAVDAGHQAGKYISELAGKLGGKGGGKPDFAMGGAPNGLNLKDALKGISFHTEG
jgi:alanyl-tRNA synthetase